MIGIDIVEIDRIKQKANQAFVDRVFCQSEKEYLQHKNLSPQTIAGMFCAKEAVLKALGCGIGNGLSLQQVEIVHSEKGQPQAVLHGKCQEVLQGLGCSVHLSISHSQMYAVAVAYIK